MKVNYANEKIKRKYLQWLKEAIGYCDSTIQNIETAILYYEDYINYADFRAFGSEKAIGFKNHIRDQKFRGQKISINTYHSHLKHAQHFFAWLSAHDGYKSKINTHSVQ